MIQASVERSGRNGNPSGNGILALTEVANSSNLVSFAERLGRGDPSGNGPSEPASSVIQASVERSGRGGNPSGIGILVPMAVDKSLNLVSFAERFGRVDFSEDRHLSSLLPKPIATAEQLSRGGSLRETCRQRQW